MIVDIQQVVQEAKMAAYQAADQLHKNTYQGRDCGACGFAWVTVYEHGGKRIHGNSKIATALKAAGVRPSYGGGLQLWNPSGYPVQNIDVLEAGARAAAEVFRQHGFVAYSGSRLD